MLSQSIINPLQYSVCGLNKNDGKKTYLLANLTSDLALTKGTGTATFTRASAQYYTDANGYAGKVLTGVPAFSAYGFSCSPATTNKCTCFGIPPADKTKYGPMRTSGYTLRKGSVCEIITRVTLDFGTVGTLLTGSENAVGSQYLITGTATLGTGDSAKQDLGATGTKSYYVDGAFVQNMRNEDDTIAMTLSGNTTAELSIVADQTAIDTFKYATVVNSYKVYDLRTTSGGSANVDIAGAMSAVITSMSLPCRILSGTVAITDSAGLNGVTPSGSVYYRYKKENFTAVAARILRVTNSASSQSRFFSPCVEELPFSTSLCPSEGATATRLATILSVPLTGNMPTPGRRCLPVITYIPKSVIIGRFEMIAYSVSDANNYIKVVSTGTVFYFEKCVSGVSEYAVVPIAAVAETNYSIRCWFNSDNTMRMTINGISASVGLSNEQNTNSTFTSWTGDNPDTWTVTGEDANNYITQHASGAKIVSNNSANVFMSKTLFTAGKVYKIEITKTNHVAGYIRWVNPRTGAIENIAATNANGVFTFSTPTVRNSIYQGAIFNFYRDNTGSTNYVISAISVKEIYNSSTTVAPVLGSSIYIGSDGTIASFGNYQKFKVTN